MNKRNVILIFVLLFVLSTGYSIMHHFASLKKVTVDIKQHAVSVTLYDAKQHQVGKLASSGTLTLSTGDYTAVPTGTTINTSAIPFTVGDNGAHVVVDPAYSETYLDSLLAKDLGSINAVIASTYAKVLGDFTVDRGSLYAKGDWYGTTITQNSPGPGASGDVYRTILRKQNGSWKIVATPAIVLSAKDYPSVPKDILKSVNEQTADSGF